MKYTLFILLSFFVVSCVHAQGNLEYLPMPKQYLGKWDVYSRAHKGLLLDIKLDKMFLYAYDPSVISYIEEYKVFDIDDEYVYLISKQIQTDAGKKEILQIMEYSEEQIQKELEKKQNSFIQYRRFKLEKSDLYDNVYFLEDADYSYDLTEKDWRKSAQSHRDKFAEGSDFLRYISKFYWTRGERK